MDDIYESEEMDEELISEQLSKLSESEANDLLNAIKNYLETEEDPDTLTCETAYLYAYFKELSYKYKSIFLFLFENANKASSLSGELARLTSIFQKKHILSIFEELNSLPLETQYAFYDNIYLDIAARYEYFTSNPNIKKR